MLVRALLFTLLAALAFTASAGAAERLEIRGAGYGHGVGMSQYGALGFAQQGWEYRAILGHYYTGTGLGRLPEGRVVRVLLRATPNVVAFTGATQVNGRALRASETYYARGRPGNVVELLSRSKRVLARWTGHLRATGAGAVVLRGPTDAAYRGALEFTPGPSGGVNAVNAVGLEDYVAGVVSRESPASWPLEALKAQAVAARTYAITTSKGGAGWDHFADTRSQVYAGVAAETPSTNQAVAATRGEVVTHEGRPVVTYFFSTSGGRTEDVENTTLGRAPLPWLKSVEDPYDRVSPRHRWNVALSLARADAKLGALVKGRLQGIEVLRRGRSPRIVAADVVGTAGRTRVDGATLRARLGLPDTWAFFTTLSARGERRPLPPEKEGGDPTGGTLPGGVVGRATRPELVGAAFGARAGTRVTVEAREGAGWRRLGATVVATDGRFAYPVGLPGAYRVRVAGGDGGLEVRVR